MRKLTMNEMRKEFLDFFEERGHQRIESFSLIPQNDPSLLLINAGMVPLKDYFTGAKKMSGNKATSCQKCIRTDDIEEVGKTDRHGTFFEMLGNFSFGDYFKEESLGWAWEFLTEKMEIPAEKLWPSVYLEDEVAYNIWKDQIGVPEEKITRLGKEHNFWELEVGPSGPCSEIHYDRGEKYGCGSQGCRPGCDCDRYLEVWNVVFSEFIKDEEGNYNPAEKPNIDTGMGLERLALVLEEAENIFETSLLKGIISVIEDLSGKKYGQDDSVDVSIRIISDHMRAVTFLVFDGVVPSNEGRGYVMRRLTRRAIRHGKLIGIGGNFVEEVSRAIINAYKEPYPEMKKDEDRVYKIINREEDRFNETISQGLNLLNKLIEDHKKSNSSHISGEESFKLYDTYGFPIDLTKEIAEENDMLVDEEDFESLMLAQKERSRSSRLIDSGFKLDDKEIQTDAEETLFTGYKTLVDQAEVIGIFVDGNKVEKLSRGVDGVLITDKTPFYGEGGGQIGDIGKISSLNARGHIKDTKKNANSVYFHEFVLDEGEIAVGDAVVLEVDRLSRRATMKNHSATHLLHKALTQVLGEHVNQAGSLVDTEKLRFDFTHFEAVSDEDLQKIESIVNDLIERNLRVSANEMTMQEATAQGAIGLFEDKYQDIVRVVSMGGESVELCGGTHVNETSEIQMFKIISESGVSAGIRRIEAFTGLNVYKYLNKIEETLEKTAENLKTQTKDLVRRSETIVQELKDKDKEIEKIKLSIQKNKTEDLIDKVEKVNGIPILTHVFEDLDMDSLRSLADQYRDKLGSGLVVFANKAGDKVTFIATVSRDLIDRGLNAGNIVREVAKVAGGNGGGRPDFATAGGKDVSKTHDAIAHVMDLLEAI